nr:pentatricopeptide repeat-containing protein At2g13600-like [Ziziphus jujuba var. spinosa]
MYKAQIFHASIIKKGLQSHVYQSNLLLKAYCKSQALSDAHKLLSHMPNPNVVSYNTILSGCFSSGIASEGLSLFDNISRNDCQSWNIVISGCVRNLMVQEALTHFVKLRSSEVRPDSFTIQLMYGGVGRMDAAKKLFDEMPKRDLVAWNALISCYSKAGMGEKSLMLFQQLGKEGIQADEYTYAIVLNELVSCFQVLQAMQMHAIIVHCGLCTDHFINNSLVELYSKCGFVTSSLALFNEIPDHDVVAWTTIITGLSGNGNMEYARWLFYKMQLAGAEPNSFTFSSLLSACANINALQRGKQLHGLVLKHGLENDVVVGSATVDMYSKCGDMEDALTMFKMMREKDTVSWNGIICGYAQNGKAINALKLFDEIVKLKSPIVAPNDVTFIGVLTACSHNGLLKEAYGYFNDMVHKHKIKPKIEHYTCMADLLGRTGLVKEAEALMLNLPFKPDEVLWSSLLGPANYMEISKLE